MSEQELNSRIREFTAKKFKEEEIPSREEIVNNVGTKALANLLEL